MILANWLRSTVLIISGLCLFLCSYKLHEISEENAYIQKHSPVIKMPVVNRVKGWGTVKVPNKIYVGHKGKEYTIDCSNQFFRSTEQVDSILVNYDQVRDKVVPSNVKLAKHLLLVVLIALCGLIVCGYTVTNLRRQTNGKTGV